MKLTAVIFFCAYMHAAANGNAQNITISMRNTPLTEVFKSIESQTGYTFIYLKEDIQKTGNISVEVTNATLQATLDACLKGQPLSYTIDDRFIVIKAKELEKNAEEKKPGINLRGKVTNEQGQFISGATVTVKGTKKASTTNENGEFFLEDIEDNAVLVVSHISFETEEIKLNGKNEVIVQLKLSISELRGVAINTGYQLLRPNEVTGSVVVITKEQLDQRIATDIISKLEGITNGLVFNKTPTGENRLRIRGESTIFGYTEPLIVIDNFPYDGDLNSINPNDVENITILKDASAASIWGVRAGNGVIVITTKRGKINQPLRLSLTVNTTISEKPDLFYQPQISSEDYINFETFLFSKGYYTSQLNNANLIAVSPVVEILNNRKLGQISPADSARQIDALRNLDFRDDFFKYIYQKGINQQYHLGLSGGSNKVNYFFSAGYDKSTKNIIGNSNNRITLNNQATYTPIKNFEIGLGLNYVQNTNITNGVIPSNIYPYTQLVDANGNELNLPKHRVTFEDTIFNHGFFDWKYYPLQEKKFLNNKSATYDTRLVTSLKYNLLKGLNIVVSYGYQHSLVRQRNLKTQESYEMRNNFNKFAILTNDNYSGSNYPIGGILKISNSDLVSHSGRAILNYGRYWNSHSISIIAGFEAREIKAETTGFTYIGYNDENGSFATPVDTIYKTYLGNGNFGTSKLGIDPPLYKGTINRFRSYFANASYTFKDRYTISGSTRIDGANYFGVKTNGKRVPLWSAGLKWDIDKEEFYHLKQISSLSLRMTYGYQGNLDQVIAALTTIVYQPPSSLTGLPFALIGNTPNPELRWEKIGQFNIGIDFTSKNNRLAGSLEYFHKEGRDLIGDAPIDPTTGITQLRGNFSDMKSDGFDFKLTSQNIQTKKFKWNTAFIFNYAAEIVTRYDLPATIGSYLNASLAIVPQVGKPLYRLLSYRWAGLDPTNGNPRIYLSDTINKTYNNATTNLVKESDLIYSGRFNPPISGSIFNSFSFNGIKLGFNISYKFNYYFRRQSISYSSLLGDWRGRNHEYALRWQKPGDELATNVPSFIYPLPSGNSIREAFYRNSNILIEKGDHIRFQFLSLSYEFNKQFLRKLNMQEMQMSFYINNLGVLWRANNKRIDPDYQQADYPPSRTYSVSIKTII